MAILIIWAPSSLASLHMVFPCLQLVVLGKPVFLCVLSWLHSYCGTFLGWAVSAGGCLSLATGWPHVCHCWKLSCYVWPLLSLKQYCFGNVNENSVQTSQLKTKPQDYFWRLAFAYRFWIFGLWSTKKNGGMGGQKRDFCLSFRTCDLNS